MYCTDEVVVSIASHQEVSKSFQEDTDVSAGEKNDLKSDYIPSNISKEKREYRCICIYKYLKMEGSNHSQVKKD